MGFLSGRIRSVTVMTVVAVVLPVATALALPTAGAADTAPGAVPSVAPLASAPTVTQADAPTVTQADAPTITAEGPILEPAVIVKPKLSIAWVRRAGSRVKLRLTCAFAACHVDVRLSTFEQLRGGKLVSLSGRAAHHGRRTLVGGVTLHLYPDQSRTFSLKLDARGHRLLKRFGSLPLELSLSGVKRARHLTLR